MLKIFEKLRKPLTAEQISQMNIGDIVHSNRRLLNDDAPVNIDFNACIVKDLLSKQLKEKVSPDLEVEIVGTSFYVRNNKYAAEVKEFVEANKLAYPEDYVTSFAFSHSYTGWHNAINDKLTYNIGFSFGYSDTIAGAVADVKHKVKEKEEMFAKLKELMAGKQDLVQRVKEIYLGILPHLMDEIGDWYICNLQITPELMNEFVDFMRISHGGTLTDEEADAWRDEIIAKFRSASYAGDVDYNRPTISVDMPEKWITEYHEKIKPAQERRERCADVLKEIRGKIDVNAILNSLGAQKRDAIIQHLLLGIPVNTEE